MILKAIAGFVASVLGGLLDKLASYMAGKQEARQEAKIDTLEAHIETLRRMDSAPVVTDADTARQHLRQRKPSAKSN